MLTGLPTDLRNQPKGLKFPGISGFSGFAVVRKPASVYAHPHARLEVYLAWWPPLLLGFGSFALVGAFRAAPSSCRAGTGPLVSKAGLEGALAGCLA